MLQFIPKGPENADDIWYYCIRKDWLANLGLEMPTNDREFLEVLKQFTFNDPDGNGKDDTWGTTSNGSKTGPGRAMTMFAVLFGQQYQVRAGGWRRDPSHGERGAAPDAAVRQGDRRRPGDRPPTGTPRTGTSRRTTCSPAGSVRWCIRSRRLIAESEAANGNDGSTLDWWTWVPLMNAAGATGDAGRERMWWTYLRRLLGDLDQGG